MRAVGLKVLKNKLSEYIRLATGGETVLVTDRDRIVAEIVPPQHGRAEWLGDAVLADAVRNGWVTPPAFPQQGAPPRSPVANLDVLLRELSEDRSR
jgi:antitoxin (DNA-binding transcriptional repressor) of toxin-antitoxin stability system